MLTDTIAAIATPVGEAGLAVIRISGLDALAVATRVFRPAGRRGVAPDQAPSHTVHYGHVVRDGVVVDEVLLTVLRAPRTFTREDTAEISCHGGLLVTRCVLEAVLAAGARMAEPGEFTQRAFVHGRIDLAQAEAVADLIHSRTELSIRAAQEQLAGRLSQRINAVRDAFMTTLAHVEAHIDFPDEDIAPDTREALMGRVREGIRTMDALLATAREGQILRRGIRAAIVGRPNAGKSSLLNLLLGHDRAIVSPIAGTTRDTIEETANFRGIPVVFVDTAGLRAAESELEEEGIRRSRAAVARAELVLHVIDGSEGLSEADAELERELSPKPRVVVLNKSDLPRVVELPGASQSAAVPVSCATGAGLEALKDAIEKAVWSGAVVAESLQVAINARHQDALRRGREAAARVLEAMEADRPLELAAFDLRIAAAAVGEVVGKTTTEDLLDAIFSQFCLGK